MDDANREQLQRVHQTVWKARGREIWPPRGAWTEGGRRAGCPGDLTSAQGALDAGLITKIAYEDELVGPGTRPWPP